MVIDSYSLSRSGHHAILFWLAKNIVPSACVLGETSKDVFTPLVQGEGVTIKILENRPIESSDRPTVVILRDPFNNYASFKKLVQSPNFGAVSFVPFLKYWTDYAKEVVGETNLLTNKIFISYNRWASSEEYRKQIILEFGNKFSIPVRFDDSLKEVVTRFGDGSSFDGFNFAYQASMMKVNERYKNYETNPLFRSEVATPEITKLSQQIFHFNPFEPVEKVIHRDAHSILDDLFG